jgi:hypothetical protein
LRSNIPIIIITAYGDAETKLNGAREADFLGLRDEIDMRGPARPVMAILIRLARQIAAMHVVRSWHSAAEVGCLLPWQVWG